MLTEIMLSMVLHEVPALEKHPDKLEAWRSDIEAMVEIDRTVTKSGVLFSPEVDRIVLAGVRWYEARFRSKPRDGDCYVRHGWDKPGPVPEWYRPRRICPAVGPMQIVQANRYVIALWPEAQKLGISEPVTVEQLRDPEMNVRHGYATIAHWKNECGGTLGTWLTAFGWGDCPSRKNPKIRKHYVDREGVRRCALITALLERTMNKPEGWICGHEKRKIPRRTARLIRAILPDDARQG